MNLIFCKPKRAKKKTRNLQFHSGFVTFLTQLLINTLGIFAEPDKTKLAEFNSLVEGILHMTITNLTGNFAYDDNEMFLEYSVKSLHKNTIWKYF